MKTFQTFMEGAEEHEALKDHAKNPFHKLLTKHGFTHVSTEHKQNRFATQNPKADYTEHKYAHPSHEDRVTVTQNHAQIGPYKNDKPHSWLHRHVQSNKIVAPTTGDTKPQLDRTLTGYAAERAAEAAKQGLTEAVSPAETELAAPSHALLLKHGYAPTGNRMKEGKFRQFSYKHPEGNVVHTFVNPGANPEQQVQHQVGKQWVHHGNLEAALKSK